MSDAKRDSKGKFLPGCDIGKDGRQPDPVGYRLIKKMNRHQLEVLINELLHMTKEEMKSYVEDPKSQVMKVMILSVILGAIDNKDGSNMDRILNRLVGKVPDVLEGNDGNPVSFIGLVRLASQKKENE